VGRGDASNITGTYTKITDDPLYIKYVFTTSGGITLPP
jgi:hypothetical protein